MTCAECKHWKARPELDNERPVGECRLNPPTLVYRGDNEATTSHQPMSWGDGTCGQFTPHGSGGLDELLALANKLPVPLIQLVIDQLTGLLARHQVASEAEKAHETRLN